MFDPATLTLDDLKAQSKDSVNKLRLALLVHGVDVNSRIGGFLSATHTEVDVAHTVDAFRQAVRMLRQEGELAN
jgi:glutamate-1-semialdehyde aminotransferase